MTNIKHLNFGNLEMQGCPYKAAQYQGFSDIAKTIGQRLQKNFDFFDTHEAMKGASFTEKINSCFLYSFMQTLFLYPENMAKIGFFEQSLKYYPIYGTGNDPVTRLEDTQSERELIELMKREYPQFTYRNILLHLRTGIRDMFVFTKGYRDVYKKLFLQKHSRKPDSHESWEGIKSMLRQTTTISNEESIVLLKAFSDDHSDDHSDFNPEYFILSENDTLSLTDKVQQKINAQKGNNQTKLGCPVMIEDFGKIMFNLLKTHIDEI